MEVLRGPLPQIKIHTLDFLEEQPSYRPASVSGGWCAGAAGVAGWTSEGPQTLGSGRQGGRRTEMLMKSFMALFPISCLRKHVLFSWWSLPGAWGQVEVVEVVDSCNCHLVFFCWLV